MLLSKLFKKKDNTPHCAAVIVAAGSSLRMGGDKLMMELCHVPVLARTLLAFQQSPLVDEIIVVTRMEKIMDVADICKKYGVTKAKKVIRGRNLAHGIRARRSVGALVRDESHRNT